MARSARTEAKRDYGPGHCKLVERGELGSLVFAPIPNSSRFFFTHTSGDRTMALIDDLKSNVAIVTNKPHLVNEIELSIKRAVVKLHREQNYYPDLIEFEYESLPASNIHQISFDDLVTTSGSGRMVRNVKYVASAERTVPAFEKISPADLFNLNGASRIDVWYSAGSAVNIRSRAVESTFSIGYYMHPLSTDAAINADWLCREYENLVTSAAAVEIFIMTSDRARIASYQKEMEQLKMQLIGDKLDDMAI